jgi:hypothetical protein
LSGSTLNIISNVVGTNNTGFEVTYNASNTNFPTNGALEVKGKSSGFGIGNIRCVGIFSAVNDAGGVSTS